MAKLNSDVMHFAAATAAATLTTSRKLLRNYAYYRSTHSETETVTRTDLLFLCHKIRFNAFGLHNLLLDEENQNSPFLVSLAGNIADSFEEIHRKTLFYDASEIETLIPIIDSQRRFWNQFTDESFYHQQLALFLENTLPVDIKKLKKNIESLPKQAHL